MTVTGGTPWPPAEGPGDRRDAGSGRHRSKSDANEPPSQPGHPGDPAYHGVGDGTGGYGPPGTPRGYDQTGTNPTNGGYTVGSAAPQPAEDWEAEWAAARRHFGAPPLPPPAAGTTRRADPPAETRYAPRSEPGRATPDTGSVTPHWAAGASGSHPAPPAPPAQRGAAAASPTGQYPMQDPDRTGQYAAGQYPTGRYSAGHQTGTGYPRRPPTPEPDHGGAEQRATERHLPDYGGDATGEYSLDEQTGHFDGFGDRPARSGRDAVHGLAAAASEETGEVPRDRRGRAHPSRAAVRRRQRRRKWLEWPFLIAFSLLAAVLIRTFFLQTFFIPSPSMHPTLLEGDRVLVNKLSYRLHDVNRGDVVVFRRPANLHIDDDDLIKRVIGLPGDTVEARDRKVYVNGRLLQEPYIPSKCKGTEDFIRVSVPSDHLFVMGDNRCDSTDSRAFGPISEDLLVGRAFVRLWPPSRLGWL